jgi:hypothetical protein
VKGEYMADEKKCKYCAMMIPEKAEICPYCRKRLKTSFITNAIIAIILIFGVIYYFNAPPSFQSYKDRAQDATAKIENQALTEKGKKIKAKHADWTNEICNTIGDKKIYAGMTAEQVKTAWGKPYKINTTIIGDREHEQWVMHKYGSDYVYFDNGIMTSLQQSK